ncbi:MAG: hypothetical protein ACOC1T_02915 [Halorhodospira sp.]
MTVLLVEFEAAVDADGTIETWRAATEGYNHSSAPGFYPEVIEETISIAREIRGEESRRRAAEVEFSDLTLINADGGLDELIDYGLDGREVRGYLLDSTESPYDERTTLFVATMGPPSFSLETITIPIRDRLSELQQRFHRGVYDGEGELGGSENVIGQPLPSPVGWVYNVSLPLVNADKRIYQFAATEEDADLEDIYIGGVAPPRGDDYEDEDDLLDNAPEGDDVRVLPRRDGSGGYVRLPADPASSVTGNVVSGDDSRIGSVLKRLALRSPTVDEDDISQDDVDALNDEMPEPVGIHEDFEIDVLRIMERACQGAGVWFGFDRFGVLRFGLWDKPTSGGPLFLVANPVDQPIADHEYDIEEFEAEPTEDRDLPVYAVTLLYGRNYTVQRGLNTDGLSADRRSFIESEWSKTRAEDESVKDKHANARSIEIESIWATRDGASAAAERILERSKTRAIRGTLSTWLAKDLINDIELGGSVDIMFPRYGMEEGRPFRVRLLELDPVENRVELGVWG